MPRPRYSFSVEAAGQVYKKTHDFVYFGGNVIHDTDTYMYHVHRICPAHHTQRLWWSFRKHTLELYNRPTALLELKIQMLDAGVSCQTNALRLCHMESTLARVIKMRCTPSLLQPMIDPLHRMETPDLPPQYPREDGERKTLSHHRILFAGFMVAY